MDTNDATGGRQKFVCKFEIHKIRKYSQNFSELNSTK